MSVRHEIQSYIADSLRNWARDNERDIKSIVLDDLNLTNTKTHDTPLVMIIDVVEDELLVEDDTHIRFRTPLLLRWFVLKQGESGLHEKINTLYDDLREWAIAAPSMSDSVLKVQFVESRDGRFDPDTAGDFTIRCDVTYVYEKAVS